MEKNNPAPQRKKLYVRFTTARDVQAVQDFYKQNKHTYVATRDPKLMEERIKSGAVTIIEDEQGKIHASSISWPITKKDSNGDEKHEWTELGSTRVEMAGLGLFKPMLSAQAVRAFLLEPPDDRFVIEIDKGNTHSRYVFENKVGARKFDAPKEVFEASQDTMDPEDRGADVDWFHIGPEAMPALAQNVLDAMQNNVITHKKTGEEYELDFSKCQLETLFKKQLEKLAQKDLGPADKPDLKKSLKQTRDKVYSKKFGM